MATKSSILSEIFQTAKGRSSLAEAMAAPLRRKMDYSSMARKAFEVQYECDVCHEFLVKVRLYESNFTISRKYIEERKESGDTYRVCRKCIEATSEKLFLINKLSLDQMPLYINDDNIFVQKRAVDRLNKGR